MTSDNLVFLTLSALIHPVVFLVFRFLSGFVSSAFLSVAGGSVGDLFTNAKVATLAFLFSAHLWLAIYEAVSFQPDCHLHS